MIPQLIAEAASLYLHFSKLRWDEYCLWSSIGCLQRYTTRAFSVMNEPTDNNAGRGLAAEIELNYFNRFFHIRRFNFQPHVTIDTRKN